MSAPLAVGITTRDRPDALARCLRSLAWLAHLDPEVLVFDDGSTVPAREQLGDEEPPVAVRWIRDPRAPGYIAGRNRLVRATAARLILLLDDDAAVLRSAAVERAIEVMDGDARVGAVAFAQSDGSGKPWEPDMQPARAQFACVVPSFIGFAHLLRREAFDVVGGYRETFEFYGEEKDYCLRLLSAGYRVVYLPDALVIHEPDRGGRNRQRYLRYVTRNDCLTALYNEPFRRVVWLVPARFALYFRMRRAWGIEDPWGWWWILRSLARLLPELARDRHPVSVDTTRLWKRLRHDPKPYVHGC